MRGDCRLARYAAILRASLLLKHEYFVLCQIPEKTYKSRLPARHGSRFSWRGRVRNMQHDVGFNIIVIRIQSAAVEDFKKNRAATRIWKRLQPRTPCEHLKPDHYGNSTLSRAIPSNPLTPRRAKKKRHFTPFSKPLQIRWALYSQSGHDLRAGRQNSKQGKKLSKSCIILGVSAQKISILKSARKRRPAPPGL